MKTKVYLIIDEASEISKRDIKVINKIGEKLMKKYGYPIMKNEN
jgi:hypothetical protein